MIRPFSLALRLFVAMTAGHILLKVLAGFIVGLGAPGGAAAFVPLPPLALLVGISALELLVAAIPAHLSALSTPLYLNDPLHSHHTPPPPFLPPAHPPLGNTPDSPFHPPPPPPPHPPHPPPP